MNDARKPIVDGGGTPEEQRARSMLESFDASPRPGARERVWSRMHAPAPKAVFRLVWLAPVAAALVVIWALGLVFDSESRRTPDESLAAHPAPPAVPSAANAPSPTSVAPAGAATLASIEGSVEIDAQAVQGATDVAEGAQIETKPGASVRLDWARVATVRASERTQLSLTRLGPPAELTLARGALSIELAEASTAPFVVRAGPWTLTALGRSFSVERLGEALIVEAASARVRVEGPSSARLEPGARFDSRIDSRIDRSSTSERAPGTSATKAPGSRSGAPTADKAKPPRSKSSPKRSPQQAFYDRAKKSEGAEAIRLFDRAAALEGPLGELAAYQAARLELTAGRPAPALRRFERLGVRFPRGTLARETRLSALECKLELGLLEDARADLDAYLARYPDTERQADLRFLRAELHRRLGDCERAFVDYAQVRDGPRAADALYLTAWCADRLEKGEVARLALGEYLRRFPSGRHAERARGYLAIGRWSDEKK